MEFTKDDMRLLGGKLDALELTGGETAALHAVLDAASDDGASGYDDAKPNGLRYQERLDILGLTWSTGGDAMFKPKGLRDEMGLDL